MILKTVDVEEAQAHLSELVDDVEHGTLVYLRKNKQFVAEIIPYQNRILGLHKGAVECSEGFDAELPNSFWMGQ